MLAVLGVLILLLPLTGAVVVGVAGVRVLRDRSHWPVVGGVGGALLASLTLAAMVIGGQHADRLPIYSWIPSNLGSYFNVEFLVDPLTAVMLVTVTGISLLVVIYSRDYMRHHDHPERGYERFFAFLGLFVFSMCALVLGGNFVLLYLGWEAVGLCSYLLIGFYYDRPSAALAARKAFIVNRIGDFGFGLGIFLIYLTFGHLDYHTVFAAATHAVEGNAEELAAVLGLPSAEAAYPVMTVIQQRLTWIALLLFCGAIGKSAQLPLYVWLPDAMEGPSPVSALIHAATMVTAGVYMVARCGAIFASSQAAMTVVAVIGGVTALFAATIALTQYDMKRILAYSTISQLGYMFLGLGVFAADAAVFHLFTHAFFKALLFLGAGSVMHAMGGIIDVRRFSGLRGLLPWTFRCFLIGSLALAGFPLLSGFWSKDQIIHAAFALHPAYGWLGLITALLTAFYTFRMVFLAFWGPQRVPDGVHAHESGPWMLRPLQILSIGAIVAGFVNVGFHAGGFLGFLEPGGWMGRFLSPVTSVFHEQREAMYGAEGHGGAGLMYLSALISLIGIAAAYALYVRRPGIPSTLKENLGGLYALSHNKYYVDEGYDAVVVQPLHQSGKMCYGFDRYFIDGLIWLITAIPRALAFALRSLQQGALQGYALSMTAGLVIIILAVILS